MQCKEFFLIVWTMLNYLNSGESVGLKNDVRVENVEICPDNEKMGSPIRNLKFTKINQTHSALSMDYYYPRDIDDHTAVAIQLDRWSDGRWVEWPFWPKQKDLCRTMMKLFPTIWLEFNKSTNMAHPDKCPIPAGHYRVDNHIFDFSDIHAPIRLGRFRLTIRITDEDKKEEFYCLICIVTVEQQATGV